MSGPSAVGSPAAPTSGDAPKLGDASTTRSLKQALEQAAQGAAEKANEAAQGALPSQPAPGAESGSGGLRERTVAAAPAAGGAQPLPSQAAPKPAPTGENRSSDTCFKVTKYVAAGLIVAGGASLAATGRCTIQ